MATSSMATDMARLHVCTLDARLCKPRADKVAFSSSSCTPAGRFLFEALSFPGAPKHISSARRRICSVSALALTPDFFHIPYTEGIPVGSKLKVFNLPCNCDRDALIEHFRTCGAFVESLEGEKYLMRIHEDKRRGNCTVVFGQLHSTCMTLDSVEVACSQAGQILNMTLETMLETEIMYALPDSKLHDHIPVDKGNTIYEAWILVNVETPAQIQMGDLQRVKLSSSKSSFCSVDEVKKL